MGQLATIFRNYQDALGFLSEEGMVYRLGEATLAGTTTGPQAYATTTPTLGVFVDAGANYIVIPLELQMMQAGTVAGGAITVLMEMDNADRYTSGGTALTVLRTDMGATSLPTGVSAFSATGSAITATNAVGIPMRRWLLGPDVSTAEGAVNSVEWGPQAGTDFLKPTATTGASWLINTSTAAGAGATWLYTMKIAVVPASWA